MPSTFSPFRYPGGKSQLYSFVKKIIEVNSYRGCIYVEPFAGGAALALKLLFNGVVSKIVINDLDKAIYAVWYSCLNRPKELINLINTTPLSIQEWDKQRSIYLSPGSHSLIELGFATLYLNRTNRSGIIKGGILGGRAQTGVYKIDARFNRETLSQKIEKIYAHRNDICISNLDAKDVIASYNLVSNSHIFFNIDPPYVKKGQNLYNNYFCNQDHRNLAEKIYLCAHPWIVTYDICDLVSELYSSYRSDILDVRYSANKKSLANEYIFFSDDLIIPK